ncbi:MAG: exodeoxyribonuclease VII small subunit [Phycisphaerales bacterium]
MSKKAKPVEQGPGFEEAMEQLESIIDQIESGEIGLESSIAAYERGVALVARCRSILADAEQRIETLSEALAEQPAPPAGHEDAS